MHQLITGLISLRCEAQRRIRGGRGNLSKTGVRKCSSVRVPVGCEALTYSLFR